MSWYGSSGVFNNRIRIYDYKRRKPLAILKYHTETVCLKLSLSLHFQPWSQPTSVQDCLASGRRRNPWFWVSRSAEKHCCIGVCKNQVTGVTFREDMKWMATSSRDSTIALWSLYPPSSLQQNQQLVNSGGSSWVDCLLPLVDFFCIFFEYFVHESCILNFTSTTKPCQGFVALGESLVSTHLQQLPEAVRII